MNKANITPKDIQDSVINNNLTMVIVDKQGIIKKYIPLKKMPRDIPEMKRLFGDENKGCASFFIYQNKKISEGCIEKRIRDAIEGFEYSKTNEMEPGVNIPEKKAKGWRKIRWKIKLFYHLSKIKIQDFFGAKS